MSSQATSDPPTNQSFDRPTRNALARMVGQARERLRTDVNDQLRRLGFQGDGTVLNLDRIAGLTEGERAAGVELRALVDHFVAQESGGENQRRQVAYDRMVREVGFTLFNRLAALRMAEERGLIVQSVGIGLASDGFQLYERIANGALGSRVETYRAYLECLWDELAQDLPLLFDRGTPESRIFPTERCLNDVIGLLNDPSLTRLWKEDETIGWVYQYYNDPEERRRMRKSSYAPRNSRELAERNQFFTPRYVVEFLVDNTLGRLWYEMQHSDTRLVRECRYLVIRPDEEFLRPGEQVPAENKAARKLNSEGLPRQAVHAPYRAKKDPRDLKILDPACGSGHFLLYAFDLLEQIYEEAWQQDASPSSEVTGHTLREDYPDLDGLRCVVPRLILSNNLHGVEIDPRACQIAVLALWLRAQRRYQQLGLKPTERPALVKGNIVVAEPMPGERDLLDQFVAHLEPPLIGALMKLVFDKMQLAGEAGILLKITEELSDAIHSAKVVWLRAPRPHQLSLFPMIEREGGEQLTLFDLSGITDEEFWDKVHGRVRDGLADYIRETANGASIQRRLFAEDTLQGLAFFDLSRTQFDVVVMNPPFGDFSKSFATQARALFPQSYNDIFGAFVERSLDSLQPGGFLGAITSRAGFFLGSFANWREKVVLEKGTLRCWADLGNRVMDDAMVEAAAYCLEKCDATGARPAVYRVLAHAGREAALLGGIDHLRRGEADPIVFRPYLRQFRLLPESPFVYWVDEIVLRKLSSLPPFEPAVGTVRAGLSTGDNPRFVRLAWEVNPSGMRNFSKASSDPVLRDGRWAFLVISGASQPWFSPATAVINWGDNGRELKEFVTRFGPVSRNIRSESSYFLPGFSWTRRSVRLTPYAIPAGCIPTASRYMAFPNAGRTFPALGVAASNIASAYMRFYGEKFEWPNFLVQTMKCLPWPAPPHPLEVDLEEVIKGEVGQRRRAYQNHEPFLEFTLPSICFPNPIDDPLIFDRQSLLGMALDGNVAGAYGLSVSEFAALTRDLHEAIVALGTSKANETLAKDEEEDREDGRDFVVTNTQQDRQEGLLSYVVGVAFGRWDMRLALDTSLVPKLPGPFAPLQSCPPGMLVGSNGLPAQRDRIASEGWLRARPHAAALPPEGTITQPSVPDQDYPLRICWDGILVDEPGHTDDVVHHVREVLSLLWPNGNGSEAEAIEHQTCEILGVRELREYYRKPGRFFADHLKRYSKSRRQAPIYWPLSTTSGTYTLWVYYHRLTSDTLYTAVNKYVDPKISTVERDLREAEARLTATSGREAAQLREQAESSRAFLAELRDFRDELLRVAALPYRPNLDDGVIINAAPLCQLFRLPKWAKDTNACWEKLQRGDYDWAHLAYTIWPDRVREKCRTDRSVAIAHGLEELYQEPAFPTRKGIRKRELEEADEDAQ